MISISPSKSADNRSVKSGITKAELLEASRQHIGDVFKAMHFFADKIHDSGFAHDYTKVDEAGIDAFYDSFSRGVKNDEFKAEPWYQRHITEERHHVKDRCPEDVNLIDILEHIADIVMAGLGRNGEVYPDKLPPELLEKAYQNTITMLIKNTVIVGGSDDPFA